MTHQVRASCASVKTWVQTPSAHIESQVWSYMCLSPHGCKGQRRKAHRGLLSPAQLWFSVRQYQRNTGERYRRGHLYPLLASACTKCTYARAHKIGMGMLWPCVSQPDNSYLTQGAGFGSMAPAHWKHTAAKWIKKNWKKLIVSICICLYL